MVLIPSLRWAQRSHCVYVTIDLQDSKDTKLELTNTDDGANGVLTFTGKGGPQNEEYALDLTLYKAVDKESSKISVTPRHIFLVIEKKESESWPRLTKDSGRHLAHIKVDWDHWADSDDEAGDIDTSKFDLSNFGGGDGGFGGMGGMGDFGGMGGLGGMGGMGGMDPAALAGLAGMGGAGDAGLGEGEGSESSDSDDDELPDLEEAK